MCDHFDYKQAAYRDDRGAVVKFTAWPDLPADKAALKAAIMAAIVGISSGIFVFTLVLLVQP